MVSETGGVDDPTVTDPAAGSMVEDPAQTPALQPVQAAELVAEPLPRRHLQRDRAGDIHKLVAA